MHIKPYLMNVLSLVGRVKSDDFSEKDWRILSQLKDLGFVEQHQHPIVHIMPFLAPYMSDVALTEAGRSAVATEAQKFARPQARRSQVVDVGLQLGRDLQSHLRRITLARLFAAWVSLRQVQLSATARRSRLILVYTSRMSAHLFRRALSQFGKIVERTSLYLGR